LLTSGREEAGAAAPGGGRVRILVRFGEDFAALLEEVADGVLADFIDPAVELLLGGEFLLELLLFFGEGGVVCLFVLLLLVLHGRAGALGRSALTETVR
jgi:hypothetical protein